MSFDLFFLLILSLLTLQKNGGNSEQIVTGDVRKGCPCRNCVEVLMLQNYCLR